MDKNLFWDVIFGQNWVRQYQENVTNASNFIAWYVRYFNDNRIISGSFSWVGTRQGHIVWNARDIQMQRIINLLKDTGYDTL